MDANPLDRDEYLVEVTVADAAIGRIRQRYSQRP
jgi:hypothetical protein